MSNFPSRYTLILTLTLLALWLFLGNGNRGVYAQADSDGQPAGQAQAVNLYLPLISSIGGPSGPTPTPTLTPPPLPPLTLTPGAATAPLADPDQTRGQPPQQGQCPAGTHLVSRENGLVPFLTEEETIYDADYTCAADEPPAAVACSVHGQPTVVGGVAACSCSQGYAGASCDICAPGHALDPASGLCKAVEQPPTAFIRSDNRSLELGSSTILTATDPAGNMIAATWTVVQPALAANTALAVAQSGCLFVPGNEATCQQTVTGTQVGFRAPLSLTTGVQVGTVQIEVRPSNGLGLTTQTLVITGKGGIPITGVGDPQMAPVLAALSAFMQQRCVGAAMLGVSRFGVPLAVYGLGRMEGRAGADWRADCGDDLTQPLANPVTNHTPMRVGSANKGITFGVLRWTLWERLKALDTDLALTVLAPDRAVSVSRLTTNKLRLTLWSIGAGGEIIPLTTLDEALTVKAFDLVTLDDNRIAAVLRTVTDELQFRSWTIAGNGQFSPGSTLTITEPDQKIVDLAAVRLLTLGNTNPRLAVLSRQNDGDFNLRLVEVAGDHTFSVIGSFQALTGIRDIALADVSTLLQRRLVVALRADDNTLTLRTFNVAADGKLSAVHSISAGAIQELALTALSANRVVAGVRTDAGNLKLIVYAIAADGTLTRQGDDEGGAITHLRLTDLTDRMVTAAVRQGDGNLKVITWSVSENGLLTRAAEESAGPIKALDLHRLSATRLLVGVRTQAETLKPIVWELASALTLQRKGDGDGGPLTDYPWSDDEVEALALLGYDFPERLLPAPLLNVLAGVTPLPIAPIADSTAFGKLEGGHELCPTLTNKADPQWQLVQIKHLLSHRTGLQREAPNLTYQIARLAELRGLTTEADFIAQEAKLRAEVGDQIVTQGKERLFYGDSTQLYVVPRPTLDEVLMLVAARCLRYPLGEEHYANTSPTLGSAIVAHLLAPFAAQLGYPEQHEGSALDQFFAQVLGIETTANSGIFAAQRVLLPGSYVQREPVGRNWNGSTYYPQAWDAKRPHCVWTGATCSFTDWLDHADQVGRLHWQWYVAPLHFVQASDDTAAGVSGGLAVEPGVYLRYMNEYWIDGYESNPSIGAQRNNTWDVTLAHNGSAGGAYAYGMHLGSDSATTFAVPYELSQGYMTEQSGSDAYMDAYRAYYVADPLSGEVTRYYNNLSNTSYDLDYGYGDAFATGHSMLYPNKSTFFVARYATGDVESYTPAALAFHNAFQADYAAGDGFAVADLLTADVYDEILIGDSSSGEVRVYNSQGFLRKTLAVGFAAGDQMGVGDYYGDDGSNELFIARVATGAVDIYTADGVLRLTLNTDFAPQFGFTVGDVVGTMGSADILVAHPGTGHVTVYTYNRTTQAYGLYTSFYSAYGAGAPLAVSAPVSKTTENELLVTSIYGSVLRWQAQQNAEGAYQFTYQGYLPAPVASGVAVAAGHGLGRRLYSCALPNGVRQPFPAGIDVIVSINQGDDKRCTNSGGCSSYYKLLPNVIKYGLCQVDWANLVPTPPSQ